MKRLTRKELIHRTDRLRQVYARYDGAKKGGKEWYNRCVTCGRLLNVKKLQGGHFIPRGCYPLRWDERNVNAQCLTRESCLVVNGEKKSIADVKVGDTVAAFDEKTFSKQEAKVLAVESFVPEKLYCVELEDGQKFYATADHKVVVGGEWRRVDDLLHHRVVDDIMEL